MTDLRTAAQQALAFIKTTNASSSFWLVPESNLNKTVKALRAALEQPEPGWRLSCGCPSHHGGIPAEWPAATREGDTATAYGVVCERHWHEYEARCPNCASLEAQNTELDRKLADLEQTSLELCKACGWRTLIPAEGCLNCARSKRTELERKPLTEEEIEKATREVWRSLPSYFDYTTSSWVEVGIRYAERAHGIK